MFVWVSEWPLGLGCVLTRVCKWVSLLEVYNVWVWKWKCVHSSEYVSLYEFLIEGMSVLYKYTSEYHTCTNVCVRMSHYEYILYECVNKWVGLSEGLIE